MRVYLTGFSASGKSTIGPLLAKRFKARFVDIDLRIEKRWGMKISEIYRRKGERAFRKTEQEVIAEQLRTAGRNAVVALGGGALQNPEIRKLVQNDGLTVYLSCSAREIYRRLRCDTDRPMLDVKPRPGETLARARNRRIRDLLDKRRRNYLRADLTISTTSRTPSQAASELYRKIRRHDGRD